MIKISNNAKKMVVASMVAGSLLYLPPIRGNTPISITPKIESSISVNHKELQKIIRKETQQEKKPLTGYNNKKSDGLVNTLELKEKKLESLLLSESAKNKALTEKVYGLKISKLDLKEKKLESLLLSESAKNKKLTEKAHELKLNVKYNSDIILTQYLPILLVSAIYGAVSGVAISILIVFASSDWS